MGVARDLKGKKRDLKGRRKGLEGRRCLKMGLKESKGIQTVKKGGLKERVSVKGDCIRIKGN